MSRVGSGVAAAVVAAVIVIGWRVDAQQGPAPLRDNDVVAHVNGAVIYRKSVRDIVQGVLSVQDTPPDAATVTKLADDALTSLISLELLYQESQARGVVVSDAAIDEEISRTRSQFPDQKAFDAALKAKGMSIADLRQDTRKTMAVNRLLESTAWKDIRVPPERLKEFYEQNREEFKHPAQTRASHILVRVPEGASTAQRNAARERAQSLLDKLHAGADFAQLAQQNSDDPGSAAHGGDLGYFAKGEMVDSFEHQASALAPGQLSGVVSTPYGFDIIKVTDRRGADYETLDEARERITAVLTKTERERRESELVAQLRQKAKIVVTDPARHD